MTLLAAVSTHLPFCSSFQSLEPSPSLSHGGLEPRGPLIHTALQPMSYHWLLSVDNLPFRVDSLMSVGLLLDASSSIHHHVRQSICQFVAFTHIMLPWHYTELVRKSPTLSIKRPEMFGPWRWSRRLLRGNDIAVTHHVQWRPVVSGAGLQSH